jgi:hypothetical protein
VAEALAEWWGKIKGLGQKTRSNRAAARAIAASGQCVKAIWGLPGETISTRLA